MSSEQGIQAARLRTCFIEAVRAGANLPAALRDHAEAVGEVKESSFDDTYLQFLDGQIDLGPRGPAWTERLKRRRAGLVELRDVPLIDGHVFIADTNTEYWVKVDSKTPSVVYWEEYLDARSAPQAQMSDSMSET
jgi:hypothetical protein